MRVELAGVRKLSAAVAAGALAGFVVGGVGGRLAMFVLRLTSDPSVRGRVSDDGFTIGILSGATVFLFGLTTVVGALGGAAYLAIRTWLPPGGRPWVAGALTGLVGGALVIRPHGIDFTELEPLWLAVGMFVALPAVYGVATSLLAERFLKPDSRLLRSGAGIASWVALLPLALTGPPGLAILAVVVALALAGPRVQGMGRLWASAPAVWLGRTALVAVGIRAAFELGRDVTTIL